MRIAGQEIKITQIILALSFFGVIYYSYFGTLGTKTIEKGVVLSGAVFVMTLLAELSWEWFKTHSPQFISDDMHASTDGKIYPLGDWSLVIKDSIDSHGLHLEVGAEGTFVLPTNSVHKIGQNTYSPVFTVEEPFDRLPPEVQDVVEKNKAKFKPPYYIGVLEQKELGNNIDITELRPSEEPVIERGNSVVFQMKNQNQQISMLVDLLKLKFGILEEVVVRASRITRKLEKGSFWNLDFWKREPKPPQQ